MSNKVNNFLRDDIDSINEYKIIDSKGMVKLDAMENPFDLDLNFEISWLIFWIFKFEQIPRCKLRELEKKITRKV